MSATEQVLRRALLGMAALVGAGTAGELALLGHVESPPQLVPFVAIGIGVFAVVALWAAPGRATVRAARIVGGVLVLAAVFGLWEHVEHNYQFEAEIRPAAELGELLVPSLFGGNPALAPGAVAVMGLLLGLATLRDPRLASS